MPAPPSTRAPGTSSCGRWRSCARPGWRSGCGAGPRSSTSPTAGSTTSSRSPAARSPASSPTSTPGWRSSARRCGCSSTRTRSSRSCASAPRSSGRGCATGPSARALVQDDEGVTATLLDLDDDAESTVRARYVVAADGNRSPTREQLGIAMRGHGLLSNSVTIYFRAGVDLAPLLEGRDQGVNYVTNPVLRGFFRLDRTGNRGFLVVNLVGDTARPEIIAAYPSAPWANVAETIDEAARARAAARRHRRARDPGHDRGHRDVARRRRQRRALRARAACSWPGTPRTRCRPTAASAATPACRTPTTWPGSSPSCSRGSPAPTCWTPMTPSAGRSASSPSSRPTRATSPGWPRTWGPRACRRSSTTCRWRSATATTPPPSCWSRATTTRCTSTPESPARGPGSRAPHVAARARRDAALDA